MNRKLLSVRSAVAECWTGVGHSLCMEEVSSGIIDPQIDKEDWAMQLHIHTQETWPGL